MDTTSLKTIVGRTMIEKNTFTNGSICMVGNIENYTYNHYYPNDKLIELLEENNKMMSQLIQQNQRQLELLEKLVDGDNK